MVFFLTWYSSTNPWGGGGGVNVSASAKIWNTTAWAANQYITIISSCDTEDWSNDAENAALPSNIKLHFEIY